MKETKKNNLTASHENPALPAKRLNLQADEAVEARGSLAYEQRMRPLWATFRNILLVVFLIFICAIVQMFVLWRVCNTGMRTAASLEHQGLPTLNGLALLQEHLAIYRLNAYEYLFAQQGEKTVKAKAVQDSAIQTRAELKNIKTLLPEGEGRQLASNLESAFADLDSEFRKVQNLEDSDFAAAMKAMDQDIPPLTERVTAAANAFSDYGYHFSGKQANATFDSFGWIKKNAIMFGTANILVVLGAVIFVRLAARRSRAQLSQTMTRLDERTGELAYERDLLRSLLDYSPDQIYFKDVQSRFIKSSKAQAENFRVKDAAELIGKTDFDFFSDEHARPAFEDEQEILRTGRPMIGKMEKETWKDGRETWALASKMPLRNKDGQIIGTFGISKDITALKQVEADLAHERNLLRTMIDNLPEAIYIKDLSGRKTLANRAELKNMGCKTEAEAIGKSDFDIYPKELAASYFAVDQTVIQTGQALINRENKIVTPAGETHWVLSSKIPLRDATGTIIGIVGMNHDITVIKEAETKLRQAHQQLLETSRQAGMAEIATNVLHNVGNVLNSVNVSASLVVDNVKKSKASSLAKVVTMFQEHEHDLGTFITSDTKGKQLPAYLAQLSEQLLADQMTTVNELTLLLKNIEHIKEIVTMQQTYARVSGVKEVINLRELVEDSLRMNLGALDRHGVEVVREFENVPPMNVEKHKVLQILVNLIRNAKHACQDSERADKRLTVRVTNGDGRIKIIVMDNGVGISPENLLRIFNHGFTTRKDGHGFGLHSGALAAKEMGGSLSVHSDGHGQGATFILELPIQPG
ncbi:MAG TPA: PAS domain-containing protein [Verrucomicrobiae bacterium]|jgi:PAS domain S-box-containing protein|nr:PAS domain-containing protein [Verrucomicrobiae bacterium]